MELESMIFPGFVTLYKDIEQKIHIYFYPGIDNFNKYYYNDLDMSESKIRYKVIKHKDNAIEYIIYNKNIVKITCKLITKYNDVEYKELKL